VSAIARAAARTLYVVRHGQTDYNAHDLLLGHRDIPLNSLGREQAAAHAITLKWLDAALPELDFVCGPLARTRETMTLLRTAAGLPPANFRVSDDLIELNYGQWEGLTWEQVRETDPDGYLAWHDDPINYTLPSGENYAQLSARLERFLATIERDTVIVSHGGISRVLVGLLGGVDKTIAPKLAIPQDRLLALHEGDYAWVSANTELHLR
jgi:broad specificity phosphatase PhoE